MDLKELKKERYRLIRKIDRLNDKLENDCISQSNHWKEKFPDRMDTDDFYFTMECVEDRYEWDIHQLENQLSLVKIQMHELGYDIDTIREYELNTIPPQPYSEMYISLMKRKRPEFDAEDLFARQLAHYNDKMDKTKYIHMIE